MTLEQWLDQWTRKPPGVQDRVQLALGFLEKHYGTDRKDKILNEIRCIDFSHPVSLPTLDAGVQLVGSKDPRVSPYRATYFTKSGHPVQRLGVASSGNISHKKPGFKANVLHPAIKDKVLYRYEVVVPIPAGEVLQSICASAKDNWSIHSQTVLADGGGLQYLIPSMNRYLRFLEQ
jgi:hypothetical protein